MKSSPIPRMALQNPVLRIAAQSAGAIACLLLLLVITLVGLRIAPGEGLHQLWTGAVGSAEDGRLYPISATLVETAPLLLAALSVGIAWRSGMFSIGAQGQILIGGLCATISAHVLKNLAPQFVCTVMLISAMGGGSLWSFIAAWLKVKRGVQEVISTIMLNYIAIHVVGWLVLGPLRAQGNYLAESDPLPPGVMFARLIPAAWSDHIQTTLHTGVLLALLAAPIMWVFQFRTRSGFNLRILGANPNAARVAGIHTEYLQLLAMAVSGALAGLAGAIILLGSTTGSLPSVSFGGTSGFTAIPVALLGGLHPIGALLSALFFGGLTQGCRNLEQNTGVSSVVIYVIQAAAVLAVVGIRAMKERSEEAGT